MKDELGNRIKSNYEDRTRYFLPRRAYSMLRLDGKAFHQFCKNLIKPFDDGLVNDMDETAKYLCKNIMGAKFAYVQSDEISILITDFEEISTQMWFDGNIQKISSVAASMATSIFNKLRWIRYVCDRYNNSITPINWSWFMDAANIKLAEFDARVFTILSKTEVENTIIWRQKDCVRNSISSVAQSLYSHKQLEGKNSSQLQEMIFQKGINWNDYAPKYKRGRMIIKETYEIEVKNKDINPKNNSCTRSRWTVIEPPIFTQERSFLSEKIPDNL